MDNKLVSNPKYVHCLRVQIYPEVYSDERINELIKYCKKFDFENVILFFNAEQFNDGHITKEEFKVKWLPTLKKTRDALLKENITVSLNPWTEVGHLDRGRTLKPGQNFQTMVDPYGNKAQLVACFLDPNWRKYYIDLMTYYVKELNPSILWIEDDFRLHNHAPLKWGGCFCPIHMKRYCEALGKEESREEFVANIIKREPTKEREAWLKVSFETIYETAKLISDNIKKLNVQTSIGLMSSESTKHMMENRDWKKLHEAFSTDLIKIDRIHLPCYQEISGKDYLYRFNMNSMVNRFFMGDDVLVYPECECDPFNSYSKDNRFLTFSNEAALALGLDGMTYDIFDFISNPINDDTGILTAVTKDRLYYDAVKQLRLCPSQLVGIVSPVFEDSVRNRKNLLEKFSTLEPDELNYFSMLSAMGFSYSLSNKKEFKNNTIILAGQNVNNFTNNQLIDLFKNNNVILDGSAVLFLKEKGLLSLIHAMDAKLIYADSNNQSLEMLLDSYHGYHNYRLSARSSAGNFVKIDYEKDKVKILTKDYNQRMEFVGNGMAESTHFFIIPYTLDNKCLAQFDLVRREFTNNFFLKQKQPYVFTSYEGINPYLYKQDNRYVLFLVNSTVEDFSNVNFLLHNINIESIVYLDKKGVSTPIGYKKSGENYSLDLIFEHLSTITLILK